MPCNISLGYSDSEWQAMGSPKNTFVFKFMVLNCGGIVSVFSGRKDKNQRKRWEFFKNNCKNSSSNSLARALKAQTEDIFVLLLNGAFFRIEKKILMKLLNAFSYFSLYLLKRSVGQHKNSLPSLRLVVFAYSSAWIMHSSIIIAQQHDPFRWGVR